MADAAVLVAQAAVGAAAAGVLQPRPVRRLSRPLGPAQRLPGVRPERAVRPAHLAAAEPGAGHAHRCLAAGRQPRRRRVRTHRRAAARPRPAPGHAHLYPAHPGTPDDGGADSAGDHPGAVAVQPGVQRLVRRAEPPALGPGQSVLVSGADRHRAAVRGHLLRPLSESAHPSGRLGPAAGTDPHRQAPRRAGPEPGRRGAGADRAVPGRPAGAGPSRATRQQAAGGGAARLGHLHAHGAARRAPPEGTIPRRRRRQLVAGPAAAADRRPAGQRTGRPAGAAGRPDPRNRLDAAGGAAGGDRLGPAAPSSRLAAAPVAHRHAGAGGGPGHPRRKSAGGPGRRPGRRPAPGPGARGPGAAAARHPGDLFPPAPHAAHPRRHRAGLPARLPAAAGRHPGGVYLERLTEAWTRTAWAHRPSTPEQVQALYDQWRGLRPAEAKA